MKVYVFFGFSTYTLPKNLILVNFNYKFLKFQAIISLNNIILQLRTSQELKILILRNIIYTIYNTA